MVAPRLMVLAAATALAAAAASARATSQTTPAPTEGQLQSHEGKETIDVPLKHTKVSLHITGFLADVTVEQTFQNPYAKKIEATYLFPLPTHAAVNAMSITTGKRTITGEIKLREDAKQTYQKALASGHVAALLTEERPNLFTQSVANIEPGADVVVTLRYVEALPWKDGGYEVVFPMVAGPRHVPATSKLTAEAAAAVQAPALPAGLRSSHDLELSADLDTGVPFSAVRSPSHQITVIRAGETHAAATLASGDTVPNKDFILRYELAGTQPSFAVLTDRADETHDGSFFFMAEPPRAAAPAELTPKELVFVIDTSSSMRGKPLAKAKEAIHHALAALHPDDTFQIVRFDDSASALGARPIANKPQNVQIALAWLDALDAGGGTDMETGIRAALEFPHDPARLRIVAFLTDGYIGNEDEVLALVKEKLGSSRIFSFGVGSAVNRYLLEELAELGRGVVQIVRPDEDTGAAVERFTARIAQPILTDVRIDWHGLAVKDVTPSAIPDLFVGQPIVLSGHYTAAGSAIATVHGRRGGRDVSYDLPVSFPAVDPRHPAVATVWARARIAELSREQLRGERDEIKHEIVALGLEHHLMTPYTAFVAVDSSRVTQGGKAETVPVPVEVPDGVDLDRSGGGEGGVVGGSVGMGYGVGISAHAMPAPMHYASMNGDLEAGFDAPVATREPIAQPVLTVHTAKAAEPTKPEIGLLLSAVRADVMRCFKLAAAKTAGLHGKLVVHLALGPDGHVASYRVKDLPGGDDTLNRCLDDKIPSWQPGARSAEIDLPFSLEETK